MASAIQLMPAVTHRHTHRRDVGACSCALDQQWSLRVPGSGECDDVVRALERRRKWVVKGVPAEGTRGQSGPLVMPSYCVKANRNALFEPGLHLAACNIHDSHKPHDLALFLGLLLELRHLLIALCQTLHVLLLGLASLQRLRNERTGRDRGVAVGKGLEREERVAEARKDRQLAGDVRT